VPMTKSISGIFFGSYVVPAGAHEVDFSFRDVDGNWDLNEGFGWTCYLAGNGSHTLVIEK